MSKVKNMPSTQISIKREIYKRLKREKREGESFSDVIERILPDSSNVDDILSCVGIAKENRDDPEITGAYKESRDVIRDKIKKRFLDEA